MEIGKFVRLEAREWREVPAAPMALLAGAGAEVVLAGVRFVVIAEALFLAALIAPSLSMGVAGAAAGAAIVTLLATALDALLSEELGPLGATGLNAAAGTLAVYLLPRLMPGVQVAGAGTMALAAALFVAEFYFHFARLYPRRRQAS